MHERVLKLYHSLPSAARSIAASARGYYLSRWRYGTDLEQRVEAALERERWPQARWQAWQEERLAFILDRGATAVPFYRAYWRRSGGGPNAWRDLRNWPVMEKETLRQHPMAFVADGTNMHRMFPDHTSGTTGTPLRIWWSRDALREWYALNEARLRRWNAVSYRDRWAILGGQLVVPFGRSRPPFWVWNAGLRQLYLSSYHLTPAFVPSYVDALRRYRVVYLLGYASALAALAELVLDRAFPVPPLRVAITNAEPLLEHQRRAIETAFGTPARETYGMAEAVCAASECAAGALHLWPDTGVLEVLHDSVNEPVAPGECGRFICTGLVNPDMPLIRYQVGDRGALCPDGAPCGCGRTLPRLAAVEGRLDDVITTPDGRRVGRLDPVFKADLPIREAQIIQESPDRIRVRVVPARSYTELAGKEIVARLRDRLGSMIITIEPVEAIPRTASGKFRAVINQVDRIA